MTQLQGISIAVTAIYLLWSGRGGVLDKIDYIVEKVHVIGCQPVQVSIDDTTVTNATLAMDKKCRLHPADGGELFVNESRM